MEICSLVIILMVDNSYFDFKTSNPNYDLTKIFGSNSIVLESIVFKEIIEYSKTILMYENFSHKTFSELYEFTQNSRSTFINEDAMSLDENLLKLFPNNYVNDIKLTLLVIRKFITIDEEEINIFMNDNK